MLVQSGIAPLDDQVGGLMPGRPYVISGSPGTGKSVSCLEFLDVALERGEPAALLTHDDPTDVLSSGAFLGMDLQRALRDERLVLIRYQLNFIKQFSRAPSTDVVFAELKRLLGSSNPVRLAIDSIVPFLEGGTSSGSASMFALIQFIDQLETTSLLTYPGDLAGLYDKRLEPIMQRAAGVFHLSTPNHARRNGLFEVRKLRYQARSLGSLAFRIQAGAGFVVVGETGTRPAEEIQRKLLVLNLADPFPEELLRILERDHSVMVRTGVASAFSDLVRAGLGALLLNVRRDVIADASSWFVSSGERRTSFPSWWSRLTYCAPAIAPAPFGPARTTSSRPTCRPRSSSPGSAASRSGAVRRARRRPSPRRRYFCSLPAMASRTSCSTPRASATQSAFTWPANGLRSSRWSGPSR
jgi:KaiC/GvpD/RAD55 family RecA-like ATPase